MFEPVRALWGVLLLLLAAGPPMCLAQEQAGPHPANAAQAIGPQAASIGPPIMLEKSPSSEAASSEAASSEIKRPIRAERNLVFRRVGESNVTADLFRPDDDLVYPLVMVIHGGAWSAGDKWQVGDHARELAQAGFVALAINYRLAPAHLIPDQIEDCRVALQWGVEQAQSWRADASRVCLWGYSAGGHLSAVLATDPQAGDPPICAVVAGGAPCDFEFIPSESTALAHVFGGTRAELPELYLQASPTQLANSHSPPFFFFHGEQDALVPAASSQRMHHRLRALGVESNYRLVPERGHLLTFIDFNSRRLAIEFLRAHTTDTP